MQWPAKLPRLQFSIRSTIICLTVCGLAFALLAHREVKRRSLIERIIAGGGSASMHQDGFSLFPETNVDALIIPQKVLNEIDLADLKYFAGLSQVSVPDWTIQGGPNSQFDRYKTSMKFARTSSGELETPLGLKLRD